MNTPPLCTRCRLTMETVNNATDLFRCPLCFQVKSVAHGSSPPKRPKCPVCDRNCVPQGEFFVCPDCKGIVDDQPDGITDASYDPTRRIQQQESQRRRGPSAHHRGGTFNPWAGPRVR
jgi:tRNA(Ile2) C34 agmatinyltransferase TiaS